MWVLNFWYSHICSARISGSFNFESWKRSDWVFLWWQVFMLLYICQVMIHWMWTHRIDPDNSAIPYLTALGDLLGTGLLAVAFKFLYLVGDRDSDVGDWATLCLIVCIIWFLSDNLFLYLNCFVSMSKCAINIYQFEIIYNNMIGF